jgi:hypothetical protein
MASIRKWHSGWQVRWYDPNGRQRTKTFTRKTDAKLFANHVEVEKQRGTYVDPQLGKGALCRLGPGMAADQNQPAGVVMDA